MVITFSGPLGAITFTGTAGLLALAAYFGFFVALFVFLWIYAGRWHDGDRDEPLDGFDHDEEAEKWRAHLRERRNRR